MFLLLLIILLGVQATYAKTELVLPQPQVVSSIEKKESLKRLEKQLEPSLSCLSRKLLEEKVVFAVSENIFAQNQYEFSGNFSKALQLSTFIFQPFYASEGWVDITNQGTVVSEKAFRKYFNGEKFSDELSDVTINPNKAPPSQGTGYRLGLANTVDDVLLASLKTKFAGKIKVLNWLDEVTDNAILTKLDDLPTSSITKMEDDIHALKSHFNSNPKLVESWKKVMNAAENGAPILRKDIDILTSLSNFDDNLISKIGTDRFDNFMKKLVEAHPKCKTCGNVGDALVGNMDDVLDDFYKVVTERAVKADGSLVAGFDDFLKEAGEQASKAKGAALTLKKLSRSWDEIAEGGWHLERFEGTIPDIETGHKLDALLKRVNPETGRFEYKALEMKNWSSARSITGGTYSQFKAYITSGNKFEYYFSDGLTDAMKGNFQNVFKDATKAQELWDVNPAFFENLGFPDVEALNGAANAGQLINHPILNFIK